MVRAAFSRTGTGCLCDDVRAPKPTPVLPVSFLLTDSWIISALSFDSKLISLFHKCWTYKRWEPNAIKTRSPKSIFSCKAGTHVLLSQKKAHHLAQCGVFWPHSLGQAVVISSEKLAAPHAKGWEGRSPGGEDPYACPCLVLMENVHRREGVDKVAPPEGFRQLWTYNIWLCLVFLPGTSPLHLNIPDLKQKCWWERENLTKNLDAWIWN